MSRPLPPPESPDGDERPSWMGAPAYMPHPELPPHAPMPGAPPYPPAAEPAPPPVGRAAGRTGYPKALGAAAIWATANLVLILALVGPAPSARAAGRVFGGLLIATLLTSLPVWMIARRRAMAFVVLLAVALPFFVGFRLIAGLA